MTAPGSASAPLRRRPRARQGEGARLRQELLDAASSLLRTTGNEDAVTLRAVAREVGIAAPSIYLHFGDRDELLRAVMADCLARFRDTLDAAVAAADGPVGQLRAGCLAYCRFAQDDPGTYAVLFSGIVAPRGRARRCTTEASAVEPSDPSTPTALSEPPLAKVTGLDAFERLVSGVRRCIEAGHARDADPFMLATNVWTHLHGGVSLRRALPHLPWAPLEQFVDGLLADLLDLTD